MTGHQSRQGGSVLPVVTVLAIAAVAASGGPAPSGQRRGLEPVDRPVLSRRLSPCCAPAGIGVDADELTAPATPPVERPVPEGEVLPEERIEALKEDVRRRPEGLAQGRELRARNLEIEPAAGVATDEARVRLRNKFTGLDRSTSEGLGFVYFPSDANIATGPDHWVQGTNSALALIQRRGAGGRRPGHRLVSSMNDHWGQDQEPFHFDPRVLYDADSGRFFLTAVTFSDSPRRSFIWISVSRSSQPTDLGPEQWCNYRIRGKRGATWADFPSTGVSRDWFVVTANNFRYSSNSYRRPFVYAVDKGSVVEDGDGCPELEMFLFRPRRDPNGGRPFTVQPARHLDTDDAAPGRAPQYLVHTPCCGPTDQYVLWRLRRDDGGEPTLSRGVVTGSAYAIPPNAPQKGGGALLDTDIQRVQSVVAREDAVYFTHTTACLQGSTPVSCVRVGRITPAPTLKDSAVVDWTLGYGPRRYLWMPAIAVNASGDVLSVFQIAGDRLFLGVGIATMAAGETVFSELATLRRGNQNQECLAGGIRNRTGDYVGASVDPGDGHTFVATGQFNDRRVGFDSTCNWNTVVGVLDF